MHRLAHALNCPNLFTGQMTVDRTRVHPFVAVAFGGLAVVGASVAIFFAWLTKANINDANRLREPVFTVQLVVAVAGLVPAGVLVYALSAGRRRMAIVALAVGLIT